MRTAFVSLVVVVSLASAAQADYYDPPQGWSSTPYFTHQQWEFSTADNPSGPEPGYVNPNDVPSALVSGDVLWVGDPTPYGLQTARRGLWVTGSFTEATTGTVTLEVPNVAAWPEKLVWLQLTYFLAGSLGAEYDSQLFTPGGEDIMVVVGSEMAVPVPGEAGWFYYEIMWHVMPQPDSETLQATINLPAGAVLALDEVAVDTICLPEPATLGLLATGGLALLRRRRG